ncbi:zinc finger protein 318-like isoform X1 [Paroedura picta]|uniref:zinc finger protein 318-like isoform X1 n=1 Tax=Paroedura picta TaxID=143630 RepID=UPI0040572E8D
MFQQKCSYRVCKKESQAFVDNWKAFFGLQLHAFPPNQNSEGFLRKEEYQELTSESADLHDDFFLPHERASQDGSGTSHILDRVTDSIYAQEQRRHSFLDVEDEEKFLYDDDNDDSNISCPTEQLTMNGTKESVSLNKRPLSPKQDACDRSKTDYEKIHDLLKTIGLYIGLTEIGEGGARTQEGLHGEKTLRPQDGPSHKSDTSEKDSIQSNTYSSETNWKNPLSPCDSSQASNDASSNLISEYAKSKTLDYDHSTSPSEQTFPSVSIVTPSAPPLPPNLPTPPPQVYQYSLSQFSAVLEAQVLQNYLHPTMAPPSYNACRRHVAHSTPAWPMYTPPQQSNPAPPEVHGLVSMTVPPNLNVVETVSITKENPEMKRNKSVLVEVPIIPTNSGLLPQSSDSDTIKRISNRKNPVSEKPQVTEGGEKLMPEQQKKLASLKSEFHRRCKQQLGMLRNKKKARGKKEDPLLVEMKRVQENIVKEICQLQMECHTAETEVSSRQCFSHHCD